MNAFLSNSSFANIYLFRESTKETLEKGVKYAQS